LLAPGELDLKVLFQSANLDEGLAKVEVTAAR
jgi:hypothetical protein